MTVLREAAPGEALLITDLQERASVAALAHVFPPELYPYPRQAIAERWSAALEDAQTRIVIAELEGDPVGVAGVRLEWLDGLYVVPDRWGTGVADLLHDRALELLRELGSSRCHLWVLEENARARRFTSVAAGVKTETRVSCRSRRTRSTLATRSTSRLVRR